MSDDDDTCSRISACSVYSSARSSEASQKTTGRFVWADEDSGDEDDDAMSPEDRSSCGTSEQNVSGMTPPSPCVPLGCYQPVQLGGVVPCMPGIPLGCNQGFTPMFMPCAPVACFAQPLQPLSNGWPSHLVNQSTAQTPADGKQSSTANARLEALAAHADALATRARQLREAARSVQAGEASAQHYEALVRNGAPGGEVSAWHDEASMGLGGSPKLEAPERDSFTSVTIKNLPAGCMQDGLRRILDEAGLAGTYDFVYVPFNFKKLVALRHALVNFERNEDAVKAIATLDGFSGWVAEGEKACEVEWSEAQQGLQAHIERYRNSPVMHHSVPDEYKPVLLRNGARIAFPTPTQKVVKPPKLRRAQQAKTSRKV